MTSAMAAPAPITMRSRRWRVGMVARFPGGADRELLLVLRLGHGRGELDTLEPVRGLEQWDERARSIGLARQFDALTVHAEGLQPGARGQLLRQLAQHRQRLDAAVLRG